MIFASFYRNFILFLTAVSFFSLFFFGVGVAAQSLECAIPGQEVVGLIPIPN